MFEGGFQKDRAKTRVLTAEARATQLQDVYERTIYAETLTNFKAWSSRLKKGSVRRNFSTSVGEEFYSEVGLSMRGITKGVSPEAAQAASSIRRQMDGVHELAQRAGVKGFEPAALKDYFPRMLDRAKFTEIRTRIGDDALRKFYTEAIIKGGNEGMTDSLAMKLARAYVRTMRTKTAGIENDLLHGIRMDDVDKLKEIFEGYDELDELLAEIESLKAAENARRGTVSFGKQRIKFDEGYEDLVTAKGKTETLKFTDMYENDARMVLSRYGKAMEGHIAMAEQLGVRSRGDFEDMKKQMAPDIEEGGGNVKREIDALEDGYNLLLGQPIERWNPGGDAAKMSRTLSGYNYSTRGGQFGVNALAEAGNIIGQGGFATMMRLWPDMGKMLKRGADGQLEHKLARFMELTSAPGISVLTKPAVRNLDELAEDFAGTSVISKLTSALDPYIKSAGRVTSVISGLGPVTDATQRLAAVTYLDKLSRFANGKKMSPGQISRLRANGIDEEMQERIFKMLREQKTEVVKREGFENLKIDEDGNSILVTAARKEARKGGAESFEDGAINLGEMEAGKVEAVVRGGTRLQVINSAVERQAQRAGNGKKLYDELRRMADDRGLEMVSDNSVSDSAARVWDSMAKRGDDIIDMRKVDPDNIDIQVNDDGTKQYWSKNGEPIFQRPVQKGVHEAKPPVGPVNTGGAGIYRKGRLIDVDMDKWIDEEALDAFSQASSREVRNVIQLGDISTSTMLFNHPAGRLIFQFMRFPMDAVNKQFLRGVHHWDAETATAWATSYGIGAAAYIAQTSIDYANDPEERAKRLTEKNVAKVAFLRTGMSSMLPAVIDTGLTALGLEAQFGMGRSSGLATAFPLESNPTGTFVKNMNKGILGAVRSGLHDDIQYSQADVRAGAQLFPGYRLLGFKNLVHALEEQFPESRKQE